MTSYKDLTSWAGMSTQLKYSLIVVSVLVLVFITILLGIGDDNQPPTTEPAQSDRMTIEQGFAAIHRDMPYVDHVCHDRIQGFLVHVATEQTSTSGAVLVVGWQANSTLKFYKMENNTWFVGNWSIGDFIQIAPDVSGIHCQQFVVDLT